MTARSDRPCDERKSVIIHNPTLKHHLFGTNIGVLVKEADTKLIPKARFYDYTQELRNHLVSTPLI